ncbi:MAG: hypothetical protein O2967_06235 [Proteobacteria bacterium]|nr:hypothetical protein [Pseudomonadota bacterium]
MPETFVINRNGQIADKHIGAITPKALEEMLLPLIRRLQKTNQTILPAAPVSESE